MPLLQHPYPIPVSLTIVGMIKGVKILIVKQILTIYSIVTWNHIADLLSEKSVPKTFNVALFFDTSFTELPHPSLVEPFQN